MATYNLLFKNLEELKIKGAGKVAVSKFNKLGVYTLYELFYFFPRAYEDKANSKNIEDIVELILKNVGNKKLVIKGLEFGIKNKRFYITKR